MIEFSSIPHISMFATERVGEAEQTKASAKLQGSWLFWLETQRRPPMYVPVFPPAAARPPAVRGPGPIGTHGPHGPVVPLGPNGLFAVRGAGRDLGANLDMSAIPIKIQSHI